MRKPLRLTTIAFFLALMNSTLPDAEEAPALGFHGVAFANIRTFQSTAEARGVVGKIMSSIGIDNPRFAILDSPDVPNAAAWIKGNHRIIGYNKDFMNQLLVSSGKSYYSLIGVMAHEIGHHLAGHTVEDMNSRTPDADGVTLSLRNALEVASSPSVRTVGNLAQMRADALVADKFAGYILNKLGASTTEATSWMETLPDPGPNSTHPRPQERTAAIISGWRLAGGPSVVASQRAPATPSPPLDRQTCQVVAPDDLKIRSAANPSGGIVFSMPRDAKGVAVDYNTCQDSGSERWCFVQYRSFQGWSNVRFLGGCSGSAPRIRGQACDVVGVSDDLKIRTQPGRTGDIVFALPPNALGVQVDFSNCQDIPHQGRWCFVKYLGYQGWSYVSFLGNCH